MLKCGAITALENYNFTLSKNFFIWNYPSHTLSDGEGNFIKESQCFVQHKHAYPRGQLILNSTSRARTFQITVFRPDIKNYEDHTQ